jgi:hypothetical protein
MLDARENFGAWQGETRRKMAFRLPATIFSKGGFGDFHCRKWELNRLSDSEAPRGEKSGGLSEKADSSPINRFGMTKDPSPEPTPDVETILHASRHRALHPARETNALHAA